MDVGAAYIQPVGVGEVFPDGVFRDLVSSLAELVCLLDYLIVNVGEVLYIENLVSAEFQIAAQGVENAQRTRVAYVNEVVDRRTAGVYLNYAGGYGL